MITFKQFLKESSIVDILKSVNFPTPPKGNLYADDKGIEMIYKGDKTKQLEKSLLKAGFSKTNEALDRRINDYTYSDEYTYEHSSLSGKLMVKYVVNREGNIKETTLYTTYPSKTQEFIDIFAPNGGVKSNKPKKLVLTDKKLQLSYGNLKEMSDAKSKLESGRPLRGKQAHYFGKWSDSEWLEKFKTYAAFLVKEIVFLTFKEKVTPEDIISAYPDIGKDAMANKSKLIKSADAKKIAEELTNNYLKSK